MKANYQCKGCINNNKAAASLKLNEDLSREEEDNENETEGSL